MDTLKITDLGSLNIDQFILSPETKLADAMAQRINSDVKNVAGGDMVHLHLQSEDGNPAISVHRSVKP